jgi:hypothetical protein
MGDTFIISGLREKRASIAGRIIELRREADKLESDLFHIDTVLRLYDVEPADIPTKGRVPVRSPYFSRNEITRRIYEVLRIEGEVCAVDLADRAMLDKGLDPTLNRKLRTNFAQRFLTSLRDLRKVGKIDRVGAGKGVRWRLTEGHWSGSGLLPAEGYPERSKPEKSGATLCGRRPWDLC